MLIRALLLLLLISSVGFAQRAESTGRLLTPDDLLRLEEIRDSVFSPDGRSVAYVIRRSKASQPFYTPNTFWSGNGLCDIWVTTVEGTTPGNITNGAAEKAGYWDPVWSPDGERLAMLSNKGGMVRIWIWGKKSGEIKLLTDRYVKYGERPVWISNEQVLCNVLPEGEMPLGMPAEEMDGMRLAMRAWQKAVEGKEPSVSVLESGMIIRAKDRPEGELRLVDVKSGHYTVIASGDLINASVSPDRRYVTYLKFTSSSATARTQMSIGERWRTPYRLSIARLSEEMVWPELSRIDGPSSVVWSPDGKEFAVISESVEDGRTKRRIFRIDPAARSIEAVTSDDFDPSEAIWVGPGRLLVRGMLRSDKHGADEKAVRRSDLFHLEGKGRYRNITSSFRSSPAALLPESNGDTFVVLVDNNIWRIGINGNKTENLTEKQQGKITSIIWPAPANKVNAVQHLIVNSGTGETAELYKLDLPSRTMTRIEKPSANAKLEAYSAETRAGVFLASDDNGSRLWISKRDSYVTLYDANAFIREIARPETRRIEYVSLDGQRLKAWLMLPNGYQSGKRYPTVCWVYAGSMYGDSVPSVFNVGGNFSLQLLAARGYAVLLPSMPLRPQHNRGGEASDPYMELTKGVVPAVDKVVEMGIADPDRLGVMGQSYGGYSVYGLVTQTTRFKAAVALAGVTDLVSMYGIFSASNRYADLYQGSGAVSMAETGQMRMGRPPWKDYDRYRRNSPLSYVERVETPLLMIHGDMDFVPIHQAEQFFTALERLGKRARFIRYWGEDHVIDMPENFKDMWQQIFRWFDEFLKPPK